MDRLSTSPSGPSRRSDAARNRDRILAAARAVLADRAGNVSMAEVARQAGVGMATLYRNFAGLQEVLEALYGDEVDELVAAARAPANSAGEALETWLRRFMIFHANKHPIARELLRQDGSHPLLGSSRDRVLAAGRPLLAAAQKKREIRAGITLEQVLDLLLAVASISADEDYLAPILQSALDGLRDPRNTGAGR